MKFTVKWEVDYYSKGLKLYCDIDENEDNVITLDDIFNFLDEGLEEGFKFTPENNVEFHDADFNIEYVIICDENGKELYRDLDYIVPENQ